MNILVVGVSHRTAPVELLERLAVGADQVPVLTQRLLTQPYLGESVVLSTCNRVEVYAAVTGFHGGLADVGAILAERAGCPVTDLVPHLYVHYDAEAVRHAFRVAAGLDSMVVGEPQILGQLREAYGQAAALGATGRLLHELMQHALRVGKRAHAETGLDRAGRSVVTAALDLGLALRADRLAGDLPAARRQGRSPGGWERPGSRGADLGGALVIGAGSMGALALATLRRAGVARLWVANRSLPHAQRLAESYGATAVSLTGIAALLPEVDTVICATASPEPVLTPAIVGPRQTPLLVLDLAVPRDVAPGVVDLPGVVLVDLDRLAAAAVPPVESDVRDAEQIVATEVDAFLSWLRGADVAPTVAALRARADDVVASELRRLGQRRQDLTDPQRADVAQTVHRVVQRLLHLPTVRVRQLAAEPGGEAYAAALRELFDLEVPAGVRASDLNLGDLHHGDLNLGDLDPSDLHPGQLGHGELGAEPGGTDVTGAVHRPPGEVAT